MFFLHKPSIFLALFVCSLLSFKNLCFAEIHLWKNAKGCPSVAFFISTPQCFWKIQLQKSIETKRFDSFFKFQFESFPRQKNHWTPYKSNYFGKELNSKRIFVYSNFFQVSFNWKKPPSHFPTPLFTLKNGCFFFPDFFEPPKTSPTHERMSREGS